MNFLRILSNKSTKLYITHQFRFICWSCGKDPKTLVVNLFCSNCNALQKPNKEDNYFKIMGVSETYDLNENDLAKKYKDLQKYLHPDKYANRYL